MVARSALVVFAYDISNDRRRLRVAEMLASVAVRVQRSVFEGRINRGRARAVASAAAVYLDAGDSLRVYVLSASGADDVAVFGTGVRVEDGPFYLL